MNIVYISMLTGKKSAGLSYSIPAQVVSQENFDDVFWFNINATPKSNIINGDKVNNTEDFPTLKICDLPEPFNKPDLVIFEGVYIFKYVKIAKECVERKIPYIIIPRSALTHYAQNKKKIKKFFGNSFFFNSFIKNANCIQYLTKREHEDSEWVNVLNNKYIIIPNGVEPKKNTKQPNSSGDIKGIFVGRSDSYQKGIDLLLEACSIIKDDLVRNKIRIDIFAPQSAQDQDDIDSMIKLYKLSSIVKKYDGIYGDEKEKKLLDSDFFLLTSRFEGHPMGLIEALSFGLPCLVTEGTNMATEVNKSSAGWTSDISVDGIVAAFQKLMAEKEKLHEKGQNALSLSKDYNWNNLARLSSEEYKKIVK